MCHYKTVTDVSGIHSGGFVQRFAYATFANCKQLVVYRIEFLKARSF